MNVEQQVQLTRHYCDQAAREWGTIHEGGVSIPLTELYVMLQARREKKRAHPGDMSDLSADADRLVHAGMEAMGEEFEKPISVGQALFENERLLILGEPGSGKSTTLQFIGLCYSAGEAQEKLGLEESHVPMLLELGLYARKIVEGDLWTVLESRVRKWLEAPDKGQAGALLLEWQKAGRLLVLLDGLDEVSPDLRREVIREISALDSNLGKPSCRIVVSSRRAGYSIAPLGSPFAEYALKPFAVKEAELYLERWLHAVGVAGSEEKVRRILKVLEKRPALRSVSDNPLILKLVALHYERREQDDPSLPEDAKVAGNRAELYQSYIREVWDRAEKRGASGTWADAEKRLIEIAWALQMENQIVLSEVNKDLLRLQMGMLAQVELGQILFAHKTIQEYLVSRHLEECWRKNPDWTWRFIRPRLHLPEWRESLLLLSAGLEPAYAQMLVKRILNAGSLGEHLVLRDFELAGQMTKENPKTDPEIVLARARNLLKSRDMNIRYAAVYTLEKIGNPAVAPVLVDALKDGDQKLRLAAVIVLGEIGDPVAVPPLLVELQNNNLNLRIWVANALGEIGDPAATPALRHSLRDALRHGDGIVCAASAIALLKIGAPAVIPALLVALQNKNPNVRIAAASALEKIGDPATVMALQVSLLDKNSNVRAAAARALGVIGDPATMPALLDAMGDEAELVRADAANALVKISDPVAVPELLDTLQNKNPNVRWLTAEALGVIGDPAAIPVLRDALLNGDARVREVVAQALGKIGDPEATPVLLNALNDRDARVCEAATSALGEIGDPAAVPALLDALQNKNPNVRWRAADALGNIGDPAAIPALRNALRDGLVCQNVVRALGAIGDPAAIPALREAMQDFQSSVRCEAALALGRIGGRPAIQLLQDAFGDKYEDVREVAVYAMGRINDPTVLPALRVALRNKDKKVRHAAANLIWEMYIQKNLHKLEWEGSTKSSSIHIIRIVRNWIRKMSVDFPVSQILLNEPIQLHDRLVVMHDSYRDPREAPPGTREKRLALTLFSLFLLGALLVTGNIYVDALKDRYKEEIASTYVNLIPTFWLLIIFLISVGLLTVLSYVWFEPLKKRLEEMISSRKTDQ